MLNKLSFNLMNELNESETNAIEIKKKVLMESDKVTIEEAAPNQEIIDAKKDSEDKGLYTEDRKDKEERLASLRIQMEKDGDQLSADEKEAIEKEIIELEAELNEGEELVNADYIGAKAEVTEDIYDNDTIIIPAGTTVSIMTVDTAVDGFGTDFVTVITDDEKEFKGIPSSNLKLIEEPIEEAEEVKEEKLEEGVPGIEVKDKVISGDEVYFRDENGQALMCHYAESYPEPEDYDEGYKPEFGGSEEALAAAKEASETGDVWEFIEVDEEGKPTGTVHGLAYGERELEDNLNLLRQVNVIKRLEEAEEPVAEAVITEEIERNSRAEYFILGAIKTVNSAHNLENIKIIRTPEGNLNIRTLDDKDIVTLGRENFSDDDMEDLRLNGYFEEVFDEADDRTYKDADEAEYYRNKELYANSCLERHYDAMMKAKEACKAKGIELDEEAEVTEECKIHEAEVKGLKEVKSQGNIFMLEDENKKIIVGENYNAEEGLIENAEIYESKEAADKDYLDRCEITTTSDEDIETIGLPDFSPNEELNREMAGKEIKAED